MSYRFDEKTIGAWIADVDRRLKAIEQPGALPPDPDWVLREVDGSLHYLYVPTGTVGPALGSK